MTELIASVFRGLPGRLHHMKTSKFILTVLAGLALVALLSLAACSGSSAAENAAEAPDTPVTGPADAQATEQAEAEASSAASADDPYAGTWELTGFLDGDKLMTVDEYAATADANPSTFPTTYELRADGTALAHNSITGDVEATWQAGDHKITVIVNGTDYVLSIKSSDDGEQYLTYDDPGIEGAISVFEKVD